VSRLASTLPVKQLELLHELRPKGAIGFLVNPPNPNAEFEIRNAQTAARALGHKLLVVNAATQREFDIAFATLVQEGADDDRANELVALAAHYRMPAASQGWGQPTCRFSRPRNSS
jgi:hypothetical protein